MQKANVVLMPNQISATCVPSWLQQLASFQGTIVLPPYRFHHAHIPQRCGCDLLARDRVTIDDHSMGAQPGPPLMLKVLICCTSVFQVLESCNKTRACSNFYVCQGLLALPACVILDKNNSTFNYNMCVRKEDNFGSPPSQIMLFCSREEINA